jgi:glycosyl hydrolase family 26
MHLARFSSAFATILVTACSAAPTAPTAPDDREDTPAIDTTTVPSPTYEYEFGARFEPPKGRVVHGMGQWLLGNPQYLAMLPANNQPASELMFIEIGDTQRPWKPDQIGARMAEISAAGRIPSMDIALRGLQPMPAVLAQMPDKTYGIDSLVAYTTQWDGRIQDFINVVRAHGKPVMLRIGGEFSGWWNGYHPYVYPVAFRKIVDMFRASGVTNVAFVWCYEPAAADDFDAVDANGNAKWYPGDNYVDWFSIDLYATSDVGGPLSGHSALTAFGRTIRFLDMAVAKRRPVIIAESSPSQFDLGNTTDAANAWTQWFDPYFALIQSRSEIKWFHYVNYDWTKAAYYVASGWKNNDMTLSASVTAKYKLELAKPKYLHAGELQLLHK